MRTVKKRCLLALVLVFSMALGFAGFTGAAAFADDIPNITADLSDIDKQLSFIQTQVSALKQTDGELTWYYTVTDLDHNGNLEFVAASQHPQKRSTNLHVWEVNADRTALTECSLAKDPEESFPDILTDAADTFHNKATDTWYYMVYDNVVLSDDEVYSVKTAVNLRKGVIDYEAFAIEHTLVTDGARSVTHTDDKGAAISPEQYNAAGNDAMAGDERSSTNFEWLTADELGDLRHLTDCFSVFMGQKAAPKDFPVPEPAALNAPQVYLTITKNPTNENKTEGDTAYFVSNANVYESLTWTFVSPDGGQYSVQSMQNMWGSISGQNSTTLTVANVNTGMSGWGVYCTFNYSGQTARTATAYLYVSAKQSAPSGTYPGTVTDYNYSTVTIDISDTVTVNVDRSICDIYGELYIGAPASVQWDGQKITACYITGDRPVPPPYEGSIGGSVYAVGNQYEIDLNNGDTVYVDEWKCSVYGNYYDGASCTAYYYDYPSADNIYEVEIYGSDDPPTPIVGVQYCPNCGAELPVVPMETCPYCGWPLNEAYDPDLNDPVLPPEPDYADSGLDDILFAPGDSIG